MANGIRTVGCILLGILPTFQIVCYIILRRHSSDNAIIKRNTTLIYVSTAGAWVAVSNLVIVVAQAFGSRNGGPGATKGACRVYYTLYMILPIISIGPQLLRAITLWGKLEQHRLMVEYGETAHLRRTKTDHPMYTLEEECDDVSSQDREDAVSAKHSNHGSLNRMSIALKERSRKMKVNLAGTTRLIMIMLVLVPIVFVISFLVSWDEDVVGLTENGNEFCFPEPTALLNNLWAFIWALTLVALTMSLILKNCQDGLGIGHEITRNIFLLFMTNGIVCFIRYFGKFQWQSIIFATQQIQFSFSMIIMPCYFPSVTAGTIYKWIRNHSIVHKNQNHGRPIPHLTAATRRSLRKSMNGERNSAIKLRNHDLEASASLDASLTVFLSSRDGLESFTEYCAKEFSVENIRFWMVVNSFHKSVDVLKGVQDYSKTDELDLKAFADEIFNEYVEVGADLQINISSSQLSTIKNGIKNWDGVKRDLFDDAQKEVFLLMSRFTYPR